MTRNLKVLGLTLVVALGLSAVIASAASAAPALFTANVGAGVQAETHGEQIGSDSLTIGAMPAMTCSVVKETGFPEEGGVHKKGPSAPSSTLAPTYEGCHVVVFGVTKPITITVNGCTYTTTATKNTAGFPFGVDLTVNCPSKPIEIHVYNNAGHTETLCTFDFSSQTINNQVQITNDASASPDDVRGHMSATLQLHSTIQSAICGNTTNPTAVYKGTHTLRATNGSSQFVDTSIS